MPFDLYVVRPAAGITAERFHGVMAGAPATRVAEHLYRVQHPDGGPWFVAELKPDGRALLSTSYSNHRFLRNLPDMVDQGISLAQSLQARLLEEVGGSEVTPDNIDTLLDPKGPYARLQAQTWRGVIDRLSKETSAALEYPLGPIDLVSEYLVFHVAGARPLDDAALVRALESDLVDAQVLAAQPGAWCAVESSNQRWLAKVLRRPDGAWQIWPAWGQSAFPRIAATVVDVAERIKEVAGGEISFLGRPYDARLRAEVEERISGLGVDFYLWTLQLPNR